MNKKRTPTNTAAKLKSQINQYIQNLCLFTDEAARSETVLEFLACFSKFHKYSSNNQFLILIQQPDATRVAGFRAWNRFNRYVKKGEKGIAI
jgi:hypothetical protein